MIDAHAPRAKSATYVVWTGCQLNVPAKPRSRVACTGDRTSGNPRFDHRTASRRQWERSGALSEVRQTSICDPGRALTRSGSTRE
jgi:hypothetical protein